MEVSSIFPGPLDEVDPVVESDGTDRRSYANTGAGRVAKNEGVEVLGLHPDVAGIEKKTALPDAAERHAQFDAGVDEDIASANGHFVDGELLGVGLLRVGRRQNLGGDV